MVERRVRDKPWEDEEAQTPTTPKKPDLPPFRSQVWLPGCVVGREALKGEAVPPAPRRVLKKRTGGVGLLLLPLPWPRCVLKKRIVRIGLFPPPVPRMF